MSEQTKKIVSPPFLLRRLEAFRIVKGDSTTYLLRDKLQDKTYDFDPWQFFILEALPGSESFERLQTAFQDRFDRTLSRKELDEFFASVADRGLFHESAAEHALLAPFMQRTYKVENGKAQPQPFSASAPTHAASPAQPASAPVPAAPPPAPPAGAPPAAGAPTQPTELPAGVQDALGMDWASTENFVGLFDPRPVIRFLRPLLLPLRYVVYVVPLLMLAALYLSFGYSDILISDLENLKLQVSLFEHLLFVFVTVHVVTTLTAATVADAFKVSVDKVGICLTLGFMPRWVLKMTGAERLSRNQTMWLHGSTLIARMVMYSVGALLWYSSRDAHSSLTEIGLLFMFSCGMGLLLESGNPLIKANGYYLLSAYLNEPHLRGKAYAALVNKLRGGVYKAVDSNLLALYALLSTTYVIFILLLVGYVIGKFVLGELALGGSGIIVALGFSVYMLWRNYEGLKRFGQTYEKQVQFDRWRSRTVPVGTPDGEIPVQRRSYWKQALLFCFVLLLFLPYQYQPSGSFTIYPLRKASITTDTPGIISDVRFDGGEAVKKGTVLATLSHDDYQAQVKILQADIQEQQHVVANLKALPKPEEVKVAEQQLEVARSQVPFSRDKAARLEKLYPAGAVTLEELETARRAAAVDRMQVVEKEAALALARTGATPDQIAAAEAKLVSLQQQLAGVVDKVDRTVLRMPFDGNILSLHLLDRANSYLPVGSVFAEVENTGQVTAQISVVESDIPYVKLGSLVRARPTSYFDDDFEGKVVLIDRNVTPKSFGNVILVLATFDNKDGRLRTGMGGEAKLEGVKMPVWKAFTNSIVRFVRLQVWGWLP